MEWGIFFTLALSSGSYKYPRHLLPVSRAVTSSSHGVLSLLFSEPWCETEDRERLISAARRAFKSCGGKCFVFVTDASQNPLKKKHLWTALCIKKIKNTRNHLVLFPQLLHVPLFAADLPLSLGAVLLGSVQLQTLLRVALGQSGQLSLEALGFFPEGKCTGEWDAEIRSDNCCRTYVTLPAFFSLWEQQELQKKQLYESKCKRDEVIYLLRCDRSIILQCSTLLSKLE